MRHRLDRGSRGERGIYIGACLLTYTKGRSLLVAVRGAIRELLIGVGSDLIGIISSLRINLGKDTEGTLLSSTKRDLVPFDHTITDGRISLGLL